MSPASHSSAGHALRMALLVGWCGVVWALSDRSDPMEDVGLSLAVPDWLLHGVEYAVGGFLARQAFEPLRPGRGALAALLFCAVWAVTDEWHQSFVPGRDSSVADVVADVVGASLGVAAHALWTRRRTSGPDSPV